MSFLPITDCNPLFCLEDTLLFCFPFHAAVNYGLAKLGCTYEIEIPFLPFAVSQFVVKFYCQQVSVYFISVISLITQNSTTTHSKACKYDGLSALLISNGTSCHCRLSSAARACLNIIVILLGHRNGGEKINIL